jgi:hypothetical protein
MEERMKSKDSLQWGIERAKKQGRIIVEPKPNEIQIDIDGPVEYAFYKKQRAILDKAGVTEEWQTRMRSSRTKGNLHITITVPQAKSRTDCTLQGFLGGDSSIGRALRVGLAAILCDDPHRAAFNWCRVVKGNKYPIAFFEERHAKRNRPGR